MADSLTARIARIRSQTVGDIPRRSARRRPDKTAIIDGEVNLTFADLDDRVNRVVAALWDNGFRKGDRIALLSHNCWQYAVLAFATLRHGGVTYERVAALTQEADEVEWTAFLSAVFAQRRTSEGGGGSGRDMADTWFGPNLFNLCERLSGYTLDAAGRLTLDQYTLLAGEGVPKAHIAERLGISRTTVIKAVNSESPPHYERTAAPTSFTPFESRVRALLLETPTMPATVLAERVGWTGSIRWFRDNVKRLRPEQQGTTPAAGWWYGLIFNNSSDASSLDQLAEARFVNPPIFLKRCDQDRKHTAHRICLHRSSSYLINH